MSHGVRGALREAILDLQAAAEDLAESRQQLTTLRAEVKSLKADKERLEWVFLGARLPVIERIWQQAFKVSNFRKPLDAARSEEKS